MVGKKMAGNEEQKRQKAREAREQGQRPSEMEATTGSTKQRNEQDREKGKGEGNRGRAEHD